MSSLQGKSISSIGVIVGIAAIVSNLAVVQSQTAPPATIADNDSIYVDGKTFAVTPGRAKGDTSAQIEALGARDLGPGAIIFRSGEKLYIVAAPVLVPGAHNQAGHNAPAPVANGQPNRVTVEYVVPKSAELQELYGMLSEHRVLEDMQGILSPFRLPEELTIKTTECGMVNSWYSRENSKPTVTICYELLRHILQSLPKKTTSGGLTPRDAAIGQFCWLTTHEVGHAMFDLFNVPIFGHAEDAADNFAGYIMLQFGKERARRSQLIEINPRRRDHAEIGDFDPPQTVLATQFDAFPEVLIRACHSPTRILRVSKPAQRCGLALGRSRLLCQLSA